MTRLQSFLDYVEETNGAFYSEGSVCWFTPYPHRKWYLLSLPFWKPLDRVPANAESIFAKTGAWAMRFPGHPSLPFGRPSHLLVAAKPYDLASLQPRARTTTRRSLENCTVEPLGLEEIARDGYQAVIDTAARQGVLPQGEKSFESMCRLMTRYDCWIAWGAYAEKRLAAFLIALQLDDAAAIIIERSRTDTLAARPNNALAYEFTKRMIDGNSCIHHVCYGMGAIEGDASQDDFKVRMGYQKIPIRDVVITRPILRFLLTLAPAMLVGKMHDAANGQGRREFAKMMALVHTARQSVPSHV